MKEKNTKELLLVENIDVSYGKLKVLFDISVKINKGEIVVIVGRNGAGKTTLFRSIAGFLKADKGSILYNKHDLTELKPFEVAQLGIRYVPQDKQVFSTLTVRENLELGAYLTKNNSWDFVYEYFPKLKLLLDRKAGNLSGGEKQMLLISMALLGYPELILMDEPTEGLAPHLVKELSYAFKKINEKATLFIIEQNLQLTVDVADRVYSMKEGKIVAEATIKDDIKDYVFERYL